MNELKELIPEKYYKNIEEELIFNIGKNRIKN
jgi:hypothetical protein